MDAFEKQIARIEQQSNDTLGLLTETAPQYFSTKQLQILYIEWRNRIKLFDAWTQFSLGIGLSAPVWFLIAIILGISGQIYWAIIALKLFPLTLVVFMGLLFWQKYHFESRGEIEHLGQLIQEELTQRRNENKIISKKNPI